jgi:hypothetical protein
VKDNKRREDLMADQRNFLMSIILDGLILLLEYYKDKLGLTRGDYKNLFGIVKMKIFFHKFFGIQAFILLDIDGSIY